MQKVKIKKPKIFNKQDKKNKQAETFFTQDYIGVVRCQNSVIQTVDVRFISAVEVDSIDFSNKTSIMQQDILKSFESWLKIAPVKMQIKTIALKANIEKYIKDLKHDFEMEENEFCKVMQQDHINHIRQLSSEMAVERRFFIIFEYIPEGNAGRTFQEASEWLWQARRNAKAYLKNSGNTVIDHDDEDVFMMEMFYLALNPGKTDVDLSIKTKDMYNKAYLYYADDKEKLLSYLPDFLDVVSPDTIEFHSDYVKVDDSYVSFLYIPSGAFQTYVIGAWLSGLINAGVGINVDIFIERKDTAKVKGKLHGTQRVSQSRLSTMGSHGDNFTSTRKAYEAGEYIKNRLEDGEYLFDVAVMITIISDSYEDLSDKVRQIELLLDTSNFNSADMKNLMAESYKSYMPLCSLHPKIFSKARRNVTLSGLASFYSFTSYEISDPGGTVLGVHRDNRSLYKHNPFYAKRYKNPNIAVLGTSGSGKTFTLQAMGIRSRLKGIQTFFLIPEKGFEYEGVAHAMGGEYIALSAGSKHRINIMEIRPIDNTNLDWLEDTDCVIPESYLAQKVEKLHVFMEIICSSMTYEEKEYLDSALMQVYFNKGIGMDNDSLIEDTIVSMDSYGHEKKKYIYKDMPILGDLYDELQKIPEAKRLCLVLKRFVTGSASSFNGPTTVNLDNKFIVIDVTKLASSSLLEVGMFIALDFMWDKIRENHTVKKSIIMDEVWKMMRDSELAGSFVQDIFKLIRGYAGSGVMATQNIIDCDSRYGKAVLNNTKSKFILQMENEELDTVAQILGLTDGERRTVRSLETGEALVMAGGNTFVLNIIPSQLEFDMIKSNVEDIEQVIERKHLEAA